MYRMNTGLATRIHLGTNACLEIESALYVRKAGYSHFGNDEAGQSEFGKVLEGWNSRLWLSEVLYWRQAEPLLVSLERWVSR